MRQAHYAIPLLALLGAEPALAQSGFYLPSATTTAGQDEFRANDGTTCRTTMDGTKRLEVGTYATGTPATENYNLPNYVKSQSQGSAGVYGRYSVSIDARPTRMDCNKLYELELERRRLEIELMKRSLTSAENQLDLLKGQSGSRGNARASMTGSIAQSDPPEAPLGLRRSISSKDGSSKNLQVARKIARNERSGPPL